MNKLVLSLSLGLLAATASAQTCSTLSVAGTGAPGTTLTFTLSGTPMGSIGILCIGDTLGSTSLSFGNLGTLDLGLAQPFTPVLMATRPGPGNPGRPSLGDTLTIRVPNGMPLLNLHAQGTGVTLDPTVPSLSFCTSDVVGFSVGA